MEFVRDETNEDFCFGRHLLAELPLSSFSSAMETNGVTCSGSRFELKFLEDRVQILSVDLNPPKDILEQVLQFLDLDSDWLTWINTDQEMVSQEIWRQDDNGNSCLIRVTRCRADAERMIRRLESVPHKQMYWMRPVIRL